MNARLCITLCVAGLSISFSNSAPGQSCQTAPSAFFEESDKALTAKYAGALLLFEEPAFSQNKLDTVASDKVSIFERGCFSLDTKFRGKRLWFAINNHSENEITDSPAYVGIQVVKLFAASQPPKPVLTAFRNRNRPWYFSGSKIAQYNYREWAYSLNDWNTKANADSAGWSYARTVLPIFKGYWHASSRPNEPTAWDKRDWWQVDPALETKYQIILENRLISFDRATDEVGAAIPFYLAVGQAQAIIIRYYSELNEQNSEVRLCFENCEDIARLQVIAAP